MIKTQINKRLERWIGETLGIDTDITLVHPAHIENGDFTFITDPKLASDYADTLRQAQGDLQKQIGRIEFVEPRFINIYLSGDFFADSINEVLESKDNFGKNDLLKGEKIFFEHTQPNPFKEFHIGHLMNNAIGESISRILKANGGELKVATYHGDVGLHVAKALWALMKDVDFTESYAMGSKAYEENEEVKKEIIEINKKIYDRSDSVVNSLYDSGRKKSFDYFESIYKRLDSKFDDHFYESQSGEVGKNLVEENSGKVFIESEGAVVFKGEEFEPKTHTRVFLTKDSLPTYEAKELGLAKIKKDYWPYTKSVTVTANEQDAFFSVVEVAIGEVFPELKGKLKHLSHGMLKLPSGKMSSRTGDVITATSLIDTVKASILEKIKDRGFDAEEQESIAEVVAIGAIKYTILRQAVGGDIIFDFDKSISFEGDSGPYLQYTFVRAKSILEKAQAEEVSKTPFDTEVKPPEGWENKEVEKILYRFPEVVEKAGREYSPHYLVTYLIELAGSFNSFYANEKIVDESDPNSNYKLALTQAVSVVLKNGLYLLGIKVPERM